MGAKPKETHNPFNERVAGEYFVGRDDAVRQFKDSLGSLHAANPNHLYVAGLNGTGKTSYLAHITDMARASGSAATIVTLNDSDTVDQNLRSVLRAIAQAIDEDERYHGPSLQADWDRGPESTHFGVARTDAITGDAFLRDLKAVQEIMGEAKIKGTLVCIDEGQRIKPGALSQLKNSLQHLSGYLVFLSLFIGETSNVITGGQELLAEKAKLAGGDYGAAAFLMGGIAMGPFENDRDAADCLALRLEHNVVAFPEDVLHRICHVEARVPRRMIKLANRLYSVTRSDSAEVASLTHLDKAFAQEHDAVIKRSIRVLGELPEECRPALRCLVRLRRAATASDVVRELHPNTPAANLPALVRLTEIDLDRAVEAEACTKDNEHYAIVDAASGFALEALLERQ